MNRQRTLSTLAATAILTCLSAVAQAPPKPAPVDSIGPDPGRHVTVSTKRPRTTGTISSTTKLIRGLDSGKLRSAIAGNGEFEILRAARASANKVFRFRLDESNEPSLFTMSTEEGDTLVARWIAIDSTRPERAIWLWDTPSHTTFIAEVPADTLRPESFVRYCEGLFVWYQRPLRLKSIELHYGNSDPGKEDVWASIDLGARPMPRTYTMQVFAQAAEDKAFVFVSVSKRYVATDYPDDACEVPERFPPLRTRLAAVSRPELFEELGKGYVDQGLLPYPDNRDAIVLKELLSRGRLTDAEVRQVVVGRFGTGEFHSALIVSSRLRTFLNAIKGKAEIEVYAQALESILLDTPIHPSMEDPLAGLVYGTMDEYGIDFTAAQLRLLRRGRCVRQTLSNLRFKPQSQETIRALESIPLAPEFEESRMRAVRLAKELSATPQPRGVAQ